MGLGANAMYTLTPRVNTILAVQLAWGFTVAMSVWTCLGVSGRFDLAWSFMSVITVSALCLSFCHFMLFHASMGHEPDSNE